MSDAGSLELVGKPSSIQMSITILNLGINMTS
jgi:hypothetical protein